MAYKITHLYRFHLAHGHLATFAGFTLPLWYKGIIDEHLAVRNSAGLWDVSHMGRFSISGTNATGFLDHVLTGAASSQPPGRAFYSLLCNEAGGIVDDLVTLKMGEDQYLMVVNASTRGRDFEWLSQHSTSFDVTVRDLSDEIALLSFQGPKAELILQGMTDATLSIMRRYHHTTARLDGLDVIISRTGYTGEDGFEVFVLDCHVNEPVKVEKVWDKILSNGAPMGVLPCGLGSRDTLRLEAGMCLYGQDIGEDVTPLEAGLEWVVRFDKGDFVGREALLKQKKSGISKVRTCFIMKAGGIPRSSYTILKGGKEIGHVTSGTFSPLLRKGLGMGYIRSEEDVIGGEVDILVRGRHMAAVLVKPPFYDQTLYGMKRSK